MAREINRIEYNGRTFYQNDIKNGNMYVAASLLSEQLEINTLEFDLVSDDTSLTNFKRNDKLTYYYDGRQMAIFYLQSVERTGPRMYHFSANSAIGLLTEGQHYGGIYTGQTVKEVLPGIMGAVPYIIKSNLEEVKLYGWLPVAQPRDNLSQVLFAIGATVKTDLDGYLRIESFWDSVSSLTGKNRIYSGAKVNYTSTVTSVVVTEHQYAEGTEEAKLFEGTTAEGDIITFNEPMHSLTASGFTILESGANYAKVSAGSGTLTGKKYIHNTRQIAKTVATAQTPNVKTVESATLISLTNSQSTAERLVNYYKWLETVDAAVVYKGEKPGDRVQIYHPYDKTDVTGCLQSADITLSNVLKAQEKVLVGYVPPVIENASEYSVREILTGNGEWTVPDGISNIRAVLIGGGEAGSDGIDGEASPPLSGYDWNLGSYVRKYVGKTYAKGQTFPQDETITSAYSAISSGGKGGNGGNGGSGGKIYQTDVEVTPGQKIAFNCGNAYVNGGIAEDTVFGEHSSSSGSVNENGYYDIVSGNTYGAKGLKGYNGGDGGAGGSVGKGGSSEDGTSGGNSLSTMNTTRSDNDDYTTATVSISAETTAGGGGGGGSGNDKGEEGKSANSSTFGGRADSSYNGNAGYAYGITPGNGGNGASGSNGVNYGCGGNGGGGGGGGGGSGRVSCQLKSHFPFTSFNISVVLSAYADAFNSSGGAGGKGGFGAPGCVILYYNAKRTINAGWLKTRDGKYFNDRFIRRFVV